LGGLDISVVVPVVVVALVDVAVGSIKGCGWRISSIS